MSKRRFGIRDCIIWGFLAFAVILLAFSLSVNKLPGNTERAAAEISRTKPKSRPRRNNNFLFI